MELIQNSVAAQTLCRIKHLQCKTSGTSTIQCTYNNDNNMTIVLEDLNDRIHNTAKNLSTMATTLPLNYMDLMKMTIYYI